MYVLDIFCAAVAILVRIQYLGSASKLGALRTKRGDQGRGKKNHPLRIVSKVSSRDKKMVQVNTTEGNSIAS